MAVHKGNTSDTGKEIWGSLTGFMYVTPQPYYMDGKLLASIVNHWPRWFCLCPICILRLLYTLYLRLSFVFHAVLLMRYDALFSEATVNLSNLPQPISDLLGHDYWHKQRRSLSVGCAQMKIDLAWGIQESEKRKSTGLLVLCFRERRYDIKYYFLVQ